MEAERVSYGLMELAMRTLRTTGWRKGDPEIDEYLLELVHERRLGFGF